MKKERKHCTAEEKVAILRRPLLEKEPISKLCDELGLQPTVFYRWQKEFFENGTAAFQTKVRTNHQAEQERAARPRSTLRATASGLCWEATLPRDSLVGSSRR
jgi:transposase-like protein